MAALNQCCCGCSLKTGTILIAGFNLAASFLQTVTTSRFLYNVNEENGDIRVMQDAMTVHIVVLVLVITHTICSAYLLFGAIQEKAAVVLQCVVVETLIIIAMTVVDGIGSADLSLIAGVSFLSYGTFAIAIINVLQRVYFQLILYSYFQTLRKSPPVNRQGSMEFAA